VALKDRSLFSFVISSTRHELRRSMLWMAVHRRIHFDEAAGRGCGARLWGKAVMQLRFVELPHAVLTGLFLSLLYWPILSAT
jgi:hypothetical protein